MSTKRATATTTAGRGSSAGGRSRRGFSAEVALRWASERLRGDRAVARAAVCRGVAALRHCSLALRSDKAIVLAAIRASAALSPPPPQQQGGGLLLSNESTATCGLAFAGDELRADPQVVVAAVARNGAALNEAADDLRLHGGLAAHVREALRARATFLDLMVVRGVLCDEGNRRLGAISGQRDIYDNVAGFAGVVCGREELRELHAAKSRIFHEAARR